MLQYCRYCANAFDYNGEGTDFLCEADAPCGNNGAGRFYDAGRAKRPNKCKHFEFRNADIFRDDESGRPAEYKPYGKRKTLEQISFFDKQEVHDDNRHQRENAQRVFL